jgi:hypothetical protein
LEALEQIFLDEGARSIEELIFHEYNEALPKPRRISFISDVGDSSKMIPYLLKKMTWRREYSEMRTSNPSPQMGHAS